MSEARKRRTPEQEERRLAALREGLKKRDESFRKTDEYRAKQSIATKKKWAEGKFDNRPVRTKKDMSPEERQRRSDAAKKVWADGKHDNQRPASRRRVSNIEYKLAPYLEALGYRHNHDGHTFIASKVPDFVDIEGRRVFEFFGNYWHRDEDVEAFIEHYVSRGWACEILWEQDALDWLVSNKELVTEEQHQEACAAIVSDERYKK